MPLRWTQFGLRSLLLVTVLVAAASRHYGDEIEANFAKWIEKLKEADFDDVPQRRTDSTPSSQQSNSTEPGFYWVDEMIIEDSNQPRRLNYPSYFLST